MSDKSPPFRAYNGDDAYIFACYSHSDTERVYSELARLRLEGFNIWFDEGVTTGSSWRDDVANALDDAHVFLLFLSPASASSNHCRKEIHYAIESKPFVIVEVSETKLDGGLKLALADIQTLQRIELDQPTYEEKLNESLQSHTKIRTRILADQTLAYTDIMHFVKFRQTHDLPLIEQFLLQHEKIIRKATEEEGGVIRSIDGDNCLLSFSDTDRALSAVVKLLQNWQTYTDSQEIDCPIKIAMSRGSLQVFRSFVIGKMTSTGATPVDIVKSMIEDLSGGYFSRDKSYVLVTDRIVEHTKKGWRFHRINSSEFFKGDDDISRAQKSLNRDLLEIPMYQVLL